MKSGTAYGTTLESLLREVREVSKPSERVWISELTQDWHDIVIAQLEELVRLPQGWDGYDGLPVTLANATFVLRMLEGICDDRSPAPQIVPGPSGDLQVEWHTLRGDVELDVRAPNHVVAWFALVGEDATEETRILTIDFTMAANWLRRITQEAAIAVNTSAA